MTRVCRAATIALTALSGSAVYVEAAVNQQLPGMAIIGLPDAALAEAKLRVRTAATQSGLSLSSRFITVNLAPAALPKHGTGFDLAIALSVLSASGHLPSSQLATTAHFGELGLDGTLRRPNGLLSAVLAARDLGFRKVMVPSASFSEAQLIPDIEVIAVPDLRSAVAWHHGEQVSQGFTHPAPSRSLQLLPEATNPHSLDMAEVTGQADAIEALVVAAAGRHHLAMVGPPGAGKTLLATRFPSLLPDLSGQESLMASSIASLGGTPVFELVTRPPFESPHHTATSASLVGGGQSAVPRIGAITRACHGVLFLDELRKPKDTQRQSTLPLVIPEEDADLIPADAPACPHCDSPCMIPWKEWWECPRCDGVRLPAQAPNFNVKLELSIALGGRSSQGLRKVKPSP